MMKGLSLALALAGTAALMPTALLAQATPTPPPQSPAQQEGAPSVPGLTNTPPQQSTAVPPQAAATAPPPAVSTGPANICRELVAFIEAQEKARNAPPPAAAAPPAAGATPPAPPKPLPMPVADAQALAGANDIPGCRDASHRLRRAGVALPPALIALAALKLEQLQTAQ